MSNSFDVMKDVFGFGAYLLVDKGDEVEFIGYTGTEDDLDARVTELAQTRGLPVYVLRGTAKYEIEAPKVKAEVL